MVVTSCKECKNKVRRFCRERSIAKGSRFCELARKGKFREVDNGG